MQERLIVGVDIGSSKVCVTVAALDEGGGARYVGHASTPSDGIVAGEIVDADALARSLEFALNEARRLAGSNVTDLLVSVAGAKLTPHERTGRLDRSGSAAFTQTDVMRALPDAARHDARTQRTVHRTVEAIAVDGEEVDDPAGVRGLALTVKTRDYTASRTLVDGLGTVAERHGCQVMALVPTGLAAGTAALTDAERQLGVAVIDIGCMSTDIAVFCAGRLQGLTTIPLGGYQISADIAQLLDIPFGDAERQKRVFGAANLFVGGEIELGARTITGWQRQAQQGDVPREAVQTIAGARLVQMFSEVATWLNQQELRGSLLAGAVLTGGGARLAGIEEVARAALGVEVRSGGVVAGDGFPSIPDTTVTASVGLLRYGVSRSTRAAPRRNSSRFDPLGAGGAHHGRRGWREPVDAGGIIDIDDQSHDRGWGRSVSRWMREFIPARGG